MDKNGAAVAQPVGTWLGNQFKTHLDWWLEVLVHLLNTAQVPMSKAPNPYTAAWPL